MDGFIQGGAGEVQLMDVLPPQLQSFSTKIDQEAFATAYESKHPGVLVVRPWESEGEVDGRRKGLKSIKKADEPTFGMDPERGAKELVRQRAMFEGLTPSHPMYDQLFENLTQTINQLERVCGLEKTQFVKGTVPQKAAEKIDPELQEKLNKYVALSKARRKASIEVGANPCLLRLIRDVEQDDELRDLAVERLMQVGAL